MMLQTGFQYLPESIVVVFLGALIGLILKVLSSDESNSSWKRVEVFSPTGFFSSAITTNYIRIRI